MKILIIGGTGFLGRHLVEEALSNEHTVTLFNRGVSQPALFPEVEHIRGDRDKDVSALQHRQWDAVIDTCGRMPGSVQATASVLAESVKHYTFISSTSVYTDFSRPGIDEHSPVEQLGDLRIEEASPTKHYGALKALCEQAATEAMPGRVLIIRPGLIVGPHDTSDRFTYWPHRVSRGGEVIAPGQPEQPVQFIDVRDLSAWIIRMVEAEQTGVYNAKGPDYMLSMQQLLEECKAASGSDARFVWVDEAFLNEQGVMPYTEMPLWVPSAMAGFVRVNCHKALAAGLSIRPLAETVRDTLAWDNTRSADEQLRAGLTGARERQLLQDWRSQRFEQQ